MNSWPYDAVYALLFGVQDYSASPDYDDLEGVHLSIQRLGVWLESTGAKIFNKTVSETIDASWGAARLVDAGLLNRTRSDFEEETERLMRDMQKSQSAREACIIYVIGHGKDDGTGRHGSFIWAKDQAYEMERFKSSLLDRFAEIAHHTLIIVDCCGAGLVDAKRVSDAPMGRQDRIEYAVESPSACIVGTSRADQSSYANTNGTRFEQAFLQALGERSEIDFLPRVLADTDTLLPDEQHPVISYIDGKNSNFVLSPPRVPTKSTFVRRVISSPEQLGLGSHHMHIDGVDERIEFPDQSHIEKGDDCASGSPFDRLESFVRYLGLSFSRTQVEVAAAGPQRSDEEKEKLYKPHTPGPGDVEEFTVFSTIPLLNRQNAIYALNKVLPRLQYAHGTVVEIEYIEAVIDENGRWHQALKSSDPIGFEARYPRELTPQYEFHLSFNIPKKPNEQEPPIHPLALIESCTRAGIALGGAFLFVDTSTDVWAYRTNRFEETLDQERLIALSKKFRRLVKQLLKDRAGQVDFWALVERLLGVWKSPYKPELICWAPGNRVPIRQLALWEASLPRDGNFWVVAANFAGDVSKDVERAMVQNLREHVEYKYFLKSHADALRLARFVERLQLEIPDVNIYDCVQAVLPRASKRGYDEHDSKDCFIAFPTASPPVGYEIARGRDGLVTHGRLLDDDAIDRLTTRLGSLASDTKSKIDLRLRPGNPHEVAIACTKLTCYAELLFQGGMDAFKPIVTDYDCLLAEEVSRASGQVTQSFLDGYMTRFSEPAHALFCMASLQSRVRQTKTFMNSHFIALDWGRVRWVIRAQGHELLGASPVRCREVLLKSKESGIIMTTAFRNRCRQDVGAKLDSFLHELEDPPMILGLDDPRLWRLDESIELPVLRRFLITA